VADPANLEQAAANAQGLGLFVRSLVGLHRGAAKDAFADFLAGKTLNANQIHFIDLIINHLTERGEMAPSLLYESPFTDISPHGPEDLFTCPQVDELLAILDHVRSTALAS
jgi:type I restriction enzyme R subunit